MSFALYFESKSGNLSATPQDSGDDGSRHRRNTGKVNTCAYISSTSPHLVELFARVDFP